MTTLERSRRRALPAVDAGFWLRSIYALCLAGATFNHARIIAAHGWGWDYGGVSRASALYWTALTFLDPLTVVLLFARPRWGLTLTVAIMVTDVAHNGGLTLLYGGGWRGWLADENLVLQSVFLVFVLASVRVAWRGLLTEEMEPQMNRDEQR
jgi:hypothetical protein